MTVIDFNRANVSQDDLNNAINALLDAATLAEEREEKRSYLGASSIGSECLRKVQFDWQRDSIHAARTKRIFHRGHASEDRVAKALGLAGFRIERGTALTSFSEVDGTFRGHADGIIMAGPVIPALKFPALWENKCLGASGWKKIEKYGLKQAYPVYYDQCQLYMAYLALDENPALFTAENADTCHLLSILVPFDAQAAQAASDRAILIIKATHAGEMLERVAKKPDDWRCKICNHKEFCWATE